MKIVKTKADDKLIYALYFFIIQYGLFFFSEKNQGIKYSFYASGILLLLTIGALLVYCFFEGITSISKSNKKTVSFCMAIVSVCFCMNLFNIIYFKHTALEFTVEQVEVSPLTHVDAYHYLSMSASDNYRVGMRFSPSERKKMNESVDAYTEITVKGTLKNTQGRSLRRITNAFNYNGLDYLYSDAKVYCEHVSCSDAITLAAGESTEYSVVIIVSAENTKIEPRIELFVTKENQQNFGITVYGRHR